MATTIFYSYAHEDEALRDQLEKHLTLLKKQGEIADWHDRKIVPGTNWAATVDNHLTKASIILLLVSPDFLASDYCYGIEMEHALEQHATGKSQVIPILLRPADWHSAPFAKLQCLPRNEKPVTTWSNQDEAFLNIVQDIRVAVDNLQSTTSRKIFNSPLVSQAASLSPYTHSTNDLPASARYQKLLWLIGAIFGVPVVATLTFSYTKNLWLTIGFILLYEILLFIVSIVTTIVTNVWQRLEKPWIEWIVAWLDIHIQGILSSYPKKYSEYLGYEHRHFDVKGLSTQNTFTLEMDQVFVDLGIVPTAANQVAVNPLQSQKQLREDGQSIWDYLSSPALISQNFVITGPPGSGKTTLLKYLVLAIIKRKGIPRRYRISYRFPFFLFLREYASFFTEKPGFSLASAIQDHLNRRWRWASPLPLNWIQQRLEKGNCLILLDGLDEVADQKIRQSVVDWVQQQMETYGKNRFIITSRPFGYLNNPLNGITLLEIRPFTNTKIEVFIRRWYFANEVMSARNNDPGIKMRADEGADDLLQRMRKKPELFELAVNPLLLTMMATVHRYRGSLPGNRVALYSEICEVFLGKRQEARGLIQEFSPGQKQQVLQTLAFHMMHNQMREIPFVEAQQVISATLNDVSPKTPPQAFLQHIENSSGLLLEKEQGVYIFAHLTFQEYLSSVHIKDLGLEQLLVAQVQNSWWRETILLYCAQADASAIISACIADSDLPLSSLRLALDSLQEAIKVQPAIREKLDDLINQHIQDQDPDWRHLIAKTLLVQHIRQMVHLNENIYISAISISNAEYQLFLEIYQEQDTHFQPDHWRSIAFPIGRGLAPALGVRSSDAVAFCNWLTDGKDLAEVYDEVGNSRYRLPKMKEVELAIKNGSLTSEQMKDVDYWVDDGQKLTNVVPHSTLPEPIRQKTFDPSQLRALIPLNIRLITLPRTLAASYTQDEAQGFVNNLSAVLELAQLLARRYSPPRYDINSNIAYYATFSHENDMPPLPILTQSINAFVEQALTSNKVMTSFLTYVHRYVKTSGIKLLADMDYNSTYPLLKSCLSNIDKSFRSHVNKIISDLGAEEIALDREAAILIEKYYAKSETELLTRAKNLQIYLRTPGFSRLHKRIYAVGYSSTTNTNYITEDRLITDFNSMQEKINRLLLGPDKLSVNAARDSIFRLTDDYKAIREHLLASNTGSILNLDYIYTHVDLLTYGLELVKTRAFNTLYIPGGIIDVGEIILFLHLTICFLSLSIAKDLLDLKQKMQLMTVKVDKDLEVMIEKHVAIYVNSTIIKARTQGELPAYEGILLVKETK